MCTDSSSVDRRRPIKLPLNELNDDILIYIFTALSIPDILRLRQASRRLYLVSEQHSVWVNACTNEIARNGIPFPRRPPTSLSPQNLKRQTLRAYKLGLNWRSPNTKLYTHASTTSKGGTIEEIKFLSHRGRNWIVTTSLTIWWDLYIRDCDTLRIVSQWSPGKALFHGMAVNSEDDSDAVIAISVQRDGYTAVDILTISVDQSRGVTVQSLTTLDTPLRPVALKGDLVVLCDHDSETLILNWKTREQGLLKSPETFQDKPLQVDFAQESIFVVRARSICIFDEPRMVVPADDLPVTLPRVTHSFGWVEGVSLALRPGSQLCILNSPQSALSLLVRNKGEDPWRLTERFQLMTLNTEFNRTPPDTSADDPTTGNDTIAFPFQLVSNISSRHRGPLRCSDIVIGSYGTAVWVQPSDWAPAGLIADSHYSADVPSTASRETLVVAMFPGLLNRWSSEACIKVTLENDGTGWSCLDYDEDRGLIALGSNDGKVTVLRL